jgi:Ca2+-binding RTX toxin-like protein
MLIKAKTKIGTGIQYALTPPQDLLVGKAVTVRSTDTSAVTGSADNQSVTISGTVSAQNNAIRLSGDRASLVIGISGTVISEAYGAEISGADSSVVNHGTIYGFFGLFLTNTSGAANSIDMVANYGAINGGVMGVILAGNQRGFLTNHGTITGTDFAFYGSDLRDVAVNRGILIGNVHLGKGSDLYDGRGGQLIGYVDAGDGNDTFRPGQLAETFLGGDGTDTVDFRAGPGVRVDLSETLANTGFARGDSYQNAEILFGSAKGADVLHGNFENNDLRGSGGNDRLFGAAGNDTLTGGMGKDTIDASDAGLAVDHIVFHALLEGGDSITGFSVLDEIMVQGTAFHGGLALGALTEERFATGPTKNAVEADDRFIFRTGDATLWFDRDGTGAAFKPVLLADFADGIVFTFNNITVF